MYVQQSDYHYTDSDKLHYAPKQWQAYALSWIHI